MADSVLVSPPTSQMLNFLRAQGDRGDHLTRVADYVSKFRRMSCPLKNPDDATWIIGDLEDTIYNARESEVNGWGKFYLPDIVTMQVIGRAEGIPCESQLVLMTCKDKRIYAYDGEELHVVAESLEDLAKTGMEYPGTKIYYKGEAFKHMTKNDWDKVKKGPEGRRLEKKHQDLVATLKSTILQNL
ncbi:uncharacterized protein V6R79_006617 [Siganus canaliculatus]